MLFVRLRFAASVADYELRELAKILKVSISWLIDAE